MAFRGEGSISNKISPQTLELFPLHPTSHQEYDAQIFEIANPPPSQSQLINFFDPHYQIQAQGGEADQVTQTQFTDFLNPQYPIQLGGQENTPTKWFESFPPPSPPQWFQPSSTPPPRNRKKKEKVEVEIDKIVTYDERGIKIKKRIIRIK